jgi:CelD/BcsL family acetyltransferase involved in cellulose biosynthesis
MRPDLVRPSDKAEKLLCQTASYIIRKHYTGKIPRAFARTGTMQYTLHNDFSEIPDAVWNALASEGISHTPFARYEYLSQWWKTLGGGEWDEADLILVSASEGGLPIGIAPLFKARHGGRDALLLVGSIEISDYLDLIVRAQDHRRFLSGLLDFLDQSRAFQGLSLDWYNLPDSSPTLQALKAESERRGRSYRAEIYRPAPHIALRGSFDAFLDGLEKKQRHEIRRKMRRAAENLPPVQFHVVETAANLELEMDAFLGLMSQDSNKAQFLRPAMREHMRAVMRQAFGNGYLWLGFLTIDGTPAAAALNFDYANKLWGYNSGVNRYFMDLSPGWVLLAHQIRWASEHGRFEFDFMRGDEDYKYRFGGVNRYVMRAVVERS